VDGRRIATVRRMTARGKVRLVAGLLLAFVVGSVSWWTQTPAFFWAIFQDSRAYPHPDDPAQVTRGAGDLEKDLLPHFRLRLPCDAEGIRYGEWEDIGPDGRLAVRFKTSPSCLDAFLRDNGLKAVPDDPIPVQEVPGAYQWRLDRADGYYSADPSDRVHLSVAVDNRSHRPDVYAWSAYH
jgi:hypothetical protein